MENPIVKVNQGKLRGINEININGTCYIAFRGVPYAKPPIGNLRFKDSVAMDSWSGVRNAMKFSDRCAQQDWTTLAIVGSDDCLYINIYTVSLEQSMPKPVMVWIHGGSFTCGSGEDIFFGPDYLIEKDVVLVTINYRVGILGFLNVDDEEAPGNQGLKDQVQALKWIQQNITQFGGDRNNVTVFGQSAGGASVHYLTISPLAQGLFHKAIIHSGVATNSWASSSKPPMESVKKLATILNKDISDVKEFVNYLRTLEAHRLIEIESKLRTHKDNILYIFPFIPSIDIKAKNPFLTKPIDEAVKDGIKIPCICGYLSHEGLITVGATTNEIYKEINEDQDNLLIHPTTLRFLKDHNVTVNDFKRFYFDDKTISANYADKFVDMISAIHFTVHIHDIMEIQSKIIDNPMYIYTFEYELEFSIMKKFLTTNMKGTCHGDDLPFLFYSTIGKAMGRPSPSPGSVEYRIMCRFTEIWTNFAKTGNPTPQKNNLITVIWKPNNNSIEYKCLKITDKLRMGSVKNITQELIDSKI